MDFLDVKSYLEEVENDEINFEEIEDVIDITIQSKKIITIKHTYTLFFYEYFLWKIDRCFKKEKQYFGIKYLLNPTKKLNTY